MVTDNQVEDIMTAIDEITNREELRKYIKDKLEDIYNDGWQSSQEEF